MSEISEVFENKVPEKTKYFVELLPEVLGEYNEINDLPDELMEGNLRQISTRNQNLEGRTHPETDVFFERRTVETDEGEWVEVVVPDFDSVYEANLSEELYESSDSEQFFECNTKLKNEVEKNPDLKKQFSEEQLEQICDGETPDGYTWHHDAEKGKMQLVDSKIHLKTGHTGGKSIWGGGNINR